jgi:catechol 2,3-dioxygenase-like lactoylglutathione lyase family enzyme
MFSHVAVGINDLERSVTFYGALLGPLGLKQRPVTPDGGPATACWVSPDQNLPRFYAYMPFNGMRASLGNGSMVAFAASNPKAVSEAYAAGIAAGGTDEGPPGLRPSYGAGYFGAYLRDPDGNKIHVVHRGDLLEASALGQNDRVFSPPLNRNVAPHEGDQ